jgi:hypothetical protein
MAAPAQLVLHKARLRSRLVFCYAADRTWGIEISERIAMLSTALAELQARELDDNSDHSLCELSKKLETLRDDLVIFGIVHTIDTWLAESATDVSHTWSSYRATVGLEDAVEWLDVGAALAPFAPVPELAQKYHREFVAQNIGSTETS